MTGKEPEPFYRSKIGLSTIYVWPKNEGDKYFRFKFYMIILVCSPLLIEVTLHFVMAIKDRLDVELSSDIGGIAGVTGFNFMNLTFVWQQEKIAHLWRNLGVSKTFGKPDNFEKRVRRLNLYSIIYCYYSYVSVCVYTLSNILEAPSCERRNVEKGLHEICGMVGKPWAPFDISPFPIKQLVLANQIFAALILATGTVSIALTTYEVASYIVLKMRHLCRLLREVFDDPDEETRRRKLIHCAKYHQHIINLHVNFNRRYKNCNGCYVIMVGIICASLANQLLKEKNVAVFLHLWGWLFSFFICCFAGQVVLMESLKVCDAAFESKWYETSIPLQKALLVLMSRAQKAFLLQATPIGTMDLNLFIAMIRTSYSYFTLLVQTT